MEIDDVFKEVGEMGKHQWKIFFSIGLSQIPIAFQMVQNVFVGAQPNFYCNAGKGSVFEGCDSLNGTTKCLSYHYNDTFTSIVSEWDLVCSRGYLKDLVQSVLMLGVLVGAVVLGSLSDAYGRLKVFFAAMALQLVVGLCSAFAPVYPVYLILRFLAGFTNGCTVVCFTLQVELVGAAWRGFCGICMAVWFALGIMIYALLAYFIRDWRYLSAVTSLSVLLLIHMYWIIPESPRWLLNQGQVTKAARVLRTIGIKNGRPVKSINLKVPEPPKNKGGKSNKTMLQLFKHKIVRNRTLVQLYLWFVCSGVYYGLTMSSGDLGSNMYVSVALSGLVEIPGYIVSAFILNRLGRKYTFMGFLLIGGMSCITIMFTPLEYEKTITSLAMGGKVSISASFAVVYIYSSELYPTVIRNVGLGLCSMSARIGGIVSPLIISLGALYPNVQFVVFGAMSLTAGLLCFLLPETLGKAMPETFEDLDNDRPSRVKPNGNGEDTKALLANDDHDLEMEEMT